MTRHDGEHVYHPDLHQLTPAPLTARRALLFDNLLYSGVLVFQVDYKAGCNLPNDM
jgi:hypothetical protein